MAVDVSIIIVTYNALDHVDTCLEAVFGAGGAGVDHEVVVVDNESTDGTVEHVRANWPQVRIVEPGRNGGMAAGNNAGMQVAAGRAFLLLNSDAFLEPGALRTMLDRLDAPDADHVAAVAPRLINVDGSPQRSVRGFPSAWRYATEFWYLRRLAPRSRAFNAFYGGGLDLARPQFVDWATGACLLVPRAAVDAAGLMDESFFMYGEEVEWLHRLAAAGRRVAWEPRAVVTHVGGGSARREWGRMYQLQLANHVRYMVLAEGPGPARRVQRLLTRALRVRARVWNLLGRRERAAAFAEGARTVAALDVADIGARSVPPWPAVERSAADPR